MHVTLATKVAALVGGVILLAVLSSTVAFVVSWHVRHVLLDTVNETVSNVRGAQDLKIALAEQRGSVSYYLLDGDRKWLLRLRQREERFLKWLNCTRETTSNPEKADILEQLEDVYVQYDKMRDKAVILYDRERLEAAPFDLVVTDICLSGMDGLEMLRRIKERQPALPVIVMTGHGTMQTAIEAMKLGAFDYHLKPFEPAEMLATIEKALESTRLSRSRVTLDPEAAGALVGEVIVGRSPGMQEVYKAIGRVAPTDATVLIPGESGTGKELVAGAIHQHSQRSHRPMLVANCVAIPDTLLESELFGYERGAFTGAAARRIGKFEQADGGTIFFDEIGDISPGIQAKILRLLQERCFERLGGNETLRVDVRVVAATNRNLEQAIADGTFRDDLYHRLNVVTICVPPLRERAGEALLSATGCTA